MKVWQKIAAGILSAALVLGLGVGIAGCGPTETPEPDPGGGEDLSQYEFVFSGEGDFSQNGGQERHLNIEVYGNEDESVVLRVEQLPQIQIYGTWVLVENKGYKIYFEDAASTYVYCAYDESAGTHSFHYSCDFGTVGTTEVTFTYSDPDFEYDGVGLGAHPPIVAGQGRSSGTTLTCNEDGTVVVGSRTGTWEYLEETDQYHFTFDVDNGYSEAFRLDEWDSTTNTLTSNIDGSFEWQLYDWQASGFGGSNAIRIDSQTGLPCGPGVDMSTYRYDEETGYHYVTSVRGVEVYYTLTESGQPNFFPEVYASRNADGTFTVVSSYGGGAFTMFYGTFTAE